MSLADELSKLDDLRTRGVLSAEEFERAKAKLLRHDEMSEPVTAVNSSRRSLTDRWIGGGCGGPGRSTGLQNWGWRLLFAPLFFVGRPGFPCHILPGLF